jgi:uncharacterized membrane protein YfhO
MCIYRFLHPYININIYEYKYKFLNLGLAIFVGAFFYSKKFDLVVPPSIIG